MSNFWQTLPRPIVGLSPMDGITDVAFRYVAAKFGRPDVIFTEFVPVEAITHNAVTVMQDFLYSEVERPVVAQIYGSNPESFYKVTIAVCAMGFDGVDVNMGCPAKSVVHGGCGAGLILDPERAKAILRACQQAVTDWVNGRSLHSVGLPPKIVKWVEEFNDGRSSAHDEEHIATGGAEGLSPSRAPVPNSAVRSGDPCERGRHPSVTGPVAICDRGIRAEPARRFIPVTVKTRIGYSENTITEWVKHLLEAEPVAISIHGRTLKQMYKGEADWEAIAAAAEIIHQTPTLVLGNGDIKSAADAVHKIRASGVDGVLIGRATYGNPWILTQKEEIRRAVQDNAVPERRWITPEEGLECLLEHARQFEILRPNIRYVAMRKHFAWYAQWIPGLRGRNKELMQINSYAELAKMCEPLS